MGPSITDKSFSSRTYTVLAQISLCYSVVIGRFPRITHPSAAHLKDALDLHVLSLPPAFVLSQDQTLILILENLSGFFVTQFYKKIWSRLNRREHIYTPKYLTYAKYLGLKNLLNKNVPPFILSQQKCRPRFSFHIHYFQRTFSKTKKTPKRVNHINPQSIPNFRENLSAKQSVA